MAESYSALGQKYRRLLDHLRQVEQERDELKAQLSDVKKSNAILHENTKKLCETILKKQKGGNDEEPWFKMSLEDKVKAAQKGVNAYFASVQDVLQKMLDANSKRTEAISNLQEELEKEKKDHDNDLRALSAADGKVVNKLAEKLKKMGVTDEEVERMIGKVKLEKDGLDFSAAAETIIDDAGKVGDRPGKVSFETETEDGIAKSVEEAVPLMNEAGELSIPPRKTPKVKTDPETEKAAKEGVRKAAEANAREAEEYVKRMNDTQKLIVRVMGETGFSEAEAILNETKARFSETPSISTMRNAMHDLVARPDEDSEFNRPIVKQVKCPIPGSSNFAVYKLTKAGREAYKHLFGAEPKEAELDAIVRMHTTAEHGYGIKKTATLIANMKFVKDMGAEVVYMTRAKEHSVKVEGGGSYVPDIIIVHRKPDGKTAKNYIEYETGKCSDEDFISKCNKISSFSKTINVIVADNAAKESTLAKFEKWKERVYSPDAEYKLKYKVTLRLSTFYEIRMGAKEEKKGVPWATRKEAAPPYLPKDAK